MARTRASEELLAAPLPDLIRDLGLAVASANVALAEGSTDVLYTIPEAEIEVLVAISVTQSTDTSVGGGLQLHAFNINASYASAYSFSEEASSRIRLLIRAAPPSEAADGDG